MNRNILTLFFFYAGKYWREWERLFAIVINVKAKSQKAANNKHWSSPGMTLKGERRCYRGFPRGKQGYYGKQIIGLLRAGLNEYKQRKRILPEILPANLKRSRTRWYEGSGFVNVAEIVRRSDDKIAVGTGGMMDRTKGISHPT